MARLSSAQHSPNRSENNPVENARTDSTPAISDQEIDPWQYESAVETVEGIIHNIESGDMELAAIFDQFAIAVEQLQACETFLKHHRQQVDLLVETLTDDADF